ncbi:MAG: CoA pyrophosphatase [Saprospiraceae bacterium]|nr:CoA pyrophosphatase [Saprospiraceae bacterium]MCB9321818.1 CoA pyrophosphatase [Lewinellaceae bacterium]
MASTPDISVIRAIENHLQTTSLPGEAAHQKMSIRHRIPSFQHAHPPKEASVLLLLYPGGEDWEVIYTKRTDTAGDRHKGQISFPGGRREAGDADALATALRETEEEIGVAANAITPLGALTSLYIPVSNFQVQPFVGFLRETPQFQLDPIEIERIISIPLYYLQTEGVVKRTAITVRGQYSLPDVPYFDLHGEVMWGATAMITAEFLEVIG